MRKTSKKLSTAELQHLAVEFVREHIDLPTLAKQFGSAPVLGMEISKDERTFCVYIPRQRPQDAIILLIFSMNSLTGRIKMLESYIDSLPTLERETRGAKEVDIKGVEKKR